MPRLFAILLALLALVPHPVLLAAAWTATPGCTPAQEECRPLCPCCPAGVCPCAQKEETPAPPPVPVPVSGSDFHPVPALPPAERGVPPAIVPQEKKVRAMPSAADRARTLALLPVHMRHCVFLI